MKGQIKAEYQDKFNPTVGFILNGKKTKVTLKEAETQAEKYVFSPIAMYYEDLEKLQKEANVRAKKVVFTKLDMSKVTRGTAFDPSTNVKKVAIDEFKEKQKQSLATFARRNGGVGHKIEALNKAELAKTKKAAELKKEKAAK
jgi:hypothetical protein